MNKLALDPQALAVPPETFSAQLDLLGRHVDFVTLETLLAGGVSARPALAVTFDDGYADVFQVALPLLRQRGIPATFFITTAALDGGSTFYWDALCHAVLASRHELPSEVSVSTSRGTFSWSCPTSPPPADATWKGGDRCRLDSRERLYEGLCRLVRRLPPRERQAALSVVASQLPGFRATPDESVSVNELRRAARHHDVEIGAHTVGHPVLARLTPGEQEGELRTSKGELERLLGARVRYLAYPYGQAGDVNDDSVRLTRAAGFEAAFMNVPGTVHDASDRYKLPRFQVRAEDPGDLYARVSPWLWGL